MVGPTLRPGQVPPRPKRQRALWLCGALRIQCTSFASDAICINSPLPSFPSDMCNASRLQHPPRRPSDGQASFVSVRHTSGLDKRCKVGKRVGVNSKSASATICHGVADDRRRGLSMVEGQRSTSRARTIDSAKAAARHNAVTAGDNPREGVRDPRYE